MPTLEERLAAMRQTLEAVEEAGEHASQKDRLRAAFKAQKEQERAAREAAKQEAEQARQAKKRATQADGIMELNGELWTYRTEGHDQVPGTKLVSGTLRVLTSFKDDKTDRLAYEVMVTRSHDQRPFKAVLPMATMEREDKFNAWWSEVAGTPVNMANRHRILLKDWIMGQDSAHEITIHMTKSGLLDDLGIYAARGHYVDAAGAVVGIDEDRGGHWCLCADGHRKRFKHGDIAGPLITHPTVPTPADATAAFKTALAVMHGHLGDHSGSIAYGWAICNLFHADFIRERQCFPHLYLFGRKHSGKTTLARRVMAMFGMGDMTPESADSVKRNPKATRNLLSEVAGIPLFVDELRQDDGVEVILNLIRSSYDGSGGRIANKEGGTTSFKVKRGFLLTGQHIVGSDAEMRRYCLVDTSSNKDDSLFHAAGAAAESLGPAATSIICRRKVLAPAVVAQSARYEEALVAAGAPRSNVLPWAVALAGLRLLWSGNNADLSPAHGLPDGAMEYALKQILMRREDIAAITSFWGGLEVMESSGVPNSGKACWARMLRVPDFTKNALDVPAWVQEAGLEPGIYLAIWLGGAHNHMVSFAAKNRRAIHTQDGILREFAGEPGYMGIHDGVVLDDATRPRRCIVFKADSTCIPAWLRAVASKDGLAQNVVE